MDKKDSKKVNSTSSNKTKIDLINDLNQKVDVLKKRKSDDNVQLPSFNSIQNLTLKEINKLLNESFKNSESIMLSNGSVLSFNSSNLIVNQTYDKYLKTIKFLDLIEGQTKPKYEIHKVLLKDDIYNVSNHHKYENHHLYMIQLVEKFICEWRYTRYSNFIVDKKEEILKNKTAMFKNIVSEMSDVKKEHKSFVRFNKEILTNIDKKTGKSWLIYLAEAKILQLFYDNYNKQTDSFAQSDMIAKKYLSLYENLAKNEYSFKLANIKIKTRTKKINEILLKNDIKSNKKITSTQRKNEADIYRNLMLIKEMTQSKDLLQTKVNLTRKISTSNSKNQTKNTTVERPRVDI